MVVSWTCGSWGEVVGLGLGVGEGVGAGCFNWKNKTTAVVSKMAVKPISPHNSHLLLFFILVCLSPVSTVGISVIIIYNSMIIISADAALD